MTISGAVFALTSLLCVTASIAAEAFASDSVYRNFSEAGLRTQDDQALDLDRLSGNRVVVNFMFTACSSVCPTQTRALAQLQRQLPASVSAHTAFLSVSIDPLNDSPAVLKAYAASMGVDASNWWFVTGEPSAIFDMAARMKLMDPTREAAGVDSHRTAIWLLDAQGRVMQRYPGESPDIARIAREIAQLQALARPPD